MRTYLRTHPWVWDVVVGFAFALYATAFHYGRTQGLSPFVSFGYSDSPDIASFAAAWDHPEIFRRDAYLCDTRYFRSYATVHIPIIRALASRSGEYGDAFIALLGAHVFLQLLGFYVLGRVLFGSRSWSVVLAILCSTTIWVAWGDFWGVGADPLPRFTFSALLGFVLAAAVRWQAKPVAWIIVMALAGLLVYVHPVSAPAMGCALWLGFLIRSPQGVSLKTRSLSLFLAGLVFTLIALPFAINYYSTLDLGHTEDIGLVSRIMKDQLSSLQSLSGGLWQFYDALQRSMVLPMGLLGFVLLLCWLKEDRVAPFAMVLAWGVGLVVVSTLVPFANERIGGVLSVSSFAEILVRGVRLVIPLLLLLFVWAGAETIHVGLGKPRVWILTLLLLVLAARFLYVNHYDLVYPRRVLAMLRGKELYVKESERRYVEALMAVRRHTPPGAGIIPMGIPGPDVRFACLRPVVFSGKDATIFVGCDHKKLIEWYVRDQERKTLESAHWDKDGGIKSYLQWAHKLGADYLLMDTERQTNRTFLSGAHLVWTNQAYTLIRVEP